MSRSQQFRTLAALATTAFIAVAVPVLETGVASATTGKKCQSATVQYRIVGVDGNAVGADWTSQGGFHQWDTVPGTVEVRLAPGRTVEEGCKYPVSLAEYTTEGSSWEVSGHQTLVDKATVYLTSTDVAGTDDVKKTWQKLTVKTPDCYSQIDLYGDDVTYDGKTGDGHGPLPYEPDNIITPYHLIAAWNGGEKPCIPGPSGSPTSTPSESAPTTPSTPTAPAGSQPPTGTVSTPTTPQPSTTPPTTPDVHPLQSTPPATPKPSPSHSSSPLAETGVGVPVYLIASGAVLVIVLGAGTVYAVGRTRRS